MRNAAIIFSLLLLITIAACKKEKVEEPQPIPYGDDVITVADSTNSCARLITTDTIKIISDTILIPVDTTARAEFYDVTDPANPIPVTVNSVSVNGGVIPYTHGRYYSSLKGTNILPATWNVVGDNTVPNCTYTNLKGRPVYNNYRLLPASIDRSKDLVITLSGFTNTRYVYIIIDDHIKRGIMFGTPPGDTRSLTFPTILLSEMTPNPEAEIEVRMENINYQSIGGKTFAFINEVILKKKITLQ